MANEIELSDLRMKLSIDLTGTITADNADVVRLFQNLAALDSAVALASFLCEEDDQKYLYRFVAQDGRIWNQTINLGIDSNPGMTFQVPDEWRLSEFEPNRVLRALCIQMIRDYGITKVEALFS